jgi:hypothetical protein
VLGWLAAVLGWLAAALGWLAAVLGWLAAAPGPERRRAGVLRAGQRPNSVI